MTTRKKTENGHAIPVSVNEDVVPVPAESLDSKFTYNARTETESLTIRTNSERELEELVARWKYQIIPKRERKLKMNDGDQCPECGGFMNTTTGHNRTTGKPYYYLVCSNAPKCEFSAYLAPITQTAHA